MEENEKSVLAIMVGALCIILSSCQETPEESSVVSKVDGISEAAVCEPLKKEKRERQMFQRIGNLKKRKATTVWLSRQILSWANKALAIFQS